MDERRLERYSAGIMSESPWFLEFKKLVQLYHSGLTPEEVRKRCIEENVFGMQTERRVITTFQYLNRRYQFMDATLTDLFCNSDLATQKLINLIAVVSGDRLFFEFLNEVYREKCILGFDVLDAMDLNAFIRNKSVESEELAAWKDTTIKQVKNNFTKFIMIDALESYDLIEDVNALEQSLGLDMVIQATGFHWERLQTQRTDCFCVGQPERKLCDGKAIGCRADCR